MLEVWCVCWGDKYSDEDVRILKGMVARNLQRPHRFWCLSDREIAGVNTFLTPVSWRGWWQKLFLFQIAKGPTLYFDLDVVITGPLDGLLSTRLSMPANWGQSGHGGCQSSVMAWGQDYSWVLNWFDPERIGEPERGNCGWYTTPCGKQLWGDQEFITYALKEPGKGEVLAMEGVRSYKYHCQGGLPPGTRVVAFHGEPKPGDVVESWVQTARGDGHVSS